MDLHQMALDEIEASFVAMKHKLKNDGEWNLELYGEIRGRMVLAWHLGVISYAEYEDFCERYQQGSTFWDT